MGDFDPIHWACVALGVMLLAVIGIGGTAYWKQHQDLRVCKADYGMFVATTQAKSEFSLRETERREFDLSTAAVNIQGDLNRANNDINKLYADNERMRLSAKTNSSSVKISSLADAAKRFNCTNGQSDFAARLEQFERGTTQLLKRGDTAIQRTIACKKYTDTLSTILIQEPQ